MIKSATIEGWNRRRLLDDYLSKLLYGNIAGFKNNRAGHGLSVDDALSLTGAYELKRLDVSEIHSRFLEIMLDPGHTLFLSSGGREAKNDQAIYRYVLKDAVSSIPALDELLSGEVATLLRSHYNVDYRLHSAAVWRTTHVPEDVAKNDPPYSLKWHCDHHTSDTVKLFVLLSDVTEQDGPFHFLDRANSKRIVWKGFRDRHNYAIGEDELEDPKALNRLTGPSGRSLFCNTTLCLHRAGIPDPGRTRDIAQFRFDAART